MIDSFKLVILVAIFQLLKIVKAAYIHMCQSQVEIEHYSIAYFNPITAFEAL